MALTGLEHSGPTTSKTTSYDNQGTPALQHVQQCLSEHALAELSDGEAAAVAELASRIMAALPAERARLVQSVADLLASDEGGA